MSEGELIAREYSTSEICNLRWREGRVVSLEHTGRISTDLWLAPGLIDLQINGYAGIDFQSDFLRLEDLQHAARGLRRDGCTGFLLTLITSEWRRLVARLRHLRKLRSQSEELKRAILGWHIEGPFLSSEPGFCGAHNPEWMRDPTEEMIRELREAAENDRVLITLAPERKGAWEAITLAIQLGMTVSCGHTNANAEQLRMAFESGASGFTHLGNACPQWLDRHDNILWRVLDLSGFRISLIPDRIHVSPGLFRLIHKAATSDSIFYTTDAMAAAGAPPGRYSIGGLELEVGPDEVVRQPGKIHFAGSALRPIEGVFRAAEMLGKPWQSAWDAFSLRPANWLGLETGMKIGGPANFCVFKMGSGNRPVDLQVYSWGRTEPAP